GWRVHRFSPGRSPSCALLCRPPYPGGLSISISLAAQATRRRETVMGTLGDALKPGAELLGDAHERARATHEEALSLPERPAQHAREPEDFDMARRAEERAARARARLAALSERPEPRDTQRAESDPTGRPPAPLPR